MFVDYSDRMKPAVARGVSLRLATLPQEDSPMPESLYQPTTPEISARRKALAPASHAMDHAGVHRDVAADGQK